VRWYPAVDVFSTVLDDVLVLVDDFSPTAVEERGGAIRLFFSSTDSRDAACAALGASGLQTRVLDVSDEDWARRSQAGLEPVTVGRITVSPVARDPHSVAGAFGRLTIVVQPSMGFGTGHHPTTRLCLAALQELPIEGVFVLDAGTGSGVLAIAAAALGAARALGIDVDDDAVRSACENLALNPGVGCVVFEVDDIARTANPEIIAGRADIVTANLTGALLSRVAPVLLRAARPRGWLVLSGILDADRDAVVGAFGAAVEVVRERREAEWLALTMNKR